MHVNEVPHTTLKPSTLDVLVHTLNYSFSIPYLSQAERTLFEEDDNQETQDDGADTSKEPGCDVLKLKLEFFPHYQHMSAFKVK